MKWFLNLPQWGRLSVAFPLALMMFLGIWHLSKGRQALEVVWATGVESVVHKALPLTVFIDESFGDAHTASVEKAISDMNGETCTLMITIAELSRADIHVRHEPCSKDAGSRPNHPACTWSNPGTEQIVIQIGQPGDVTMSYLMAYHELTHGWGLAHDGVYKVPEEATDSLMFVPITANNSFEHAYRLSHGLHLPRLSDKDGAALRGRYCGAKKEGGEPPFFMQLEPRSQDCQIMYRGKERHECAHKGLSPLGAVFCIQSGRFGAPASGFVVDS